LRRALGVLAEALGSRRVPDAGLTLWWWRWAREIASRYSSEIHVFEPQTWAAQIAREDLKEFDVVQVHEFGLGVESGKFEMEEFETDGASFVLGRSKRQQSGEGNLVEIQSWLEQNRVKRIDLIMMNIEGYEFKLIPYMIEKGIFGMVKFFMCQFHPASYEDEDAYEAIRKQMGEIMDVHFDYGTMLMCWKSRETPKRRVAAKKGGRKE